MIPVAEDQIGGAIVRRRISRGSLPALMAGERLTRDEVLAMPTANRRALVNNEALWLSPRDAEPELSASMVLRREHKHKR